MFVLFRVVQQLAAGIPPWLLTLAGLLATIAGIALISGGFAMHQPLITRGGIIVLLATVLSAVAAKRARR